MTNRMSSYMPKRIASWLRAANNRDTPNGADNQQQQLQLPPAAAATADDQSPSGAGLTVQIPAKRLKTDLNVPITQPPQMVQFPPTMNYVNLSECSKCNIYEE